MGHHPDSGCGPAAVRAGAARGDEPARDLALTAEDGRIVALLISPEVLADLEDDLALARNRLDELDGVKPTPHEEFVRQLGED